MAQNKTVATDQPVDAFLDKVTPEPKRADALTLCEMMRKASGEAPAMWGPSIVGFGSRHYRYDSGREGDILKMGFSPRAAALTLYVSTSYPGGAELLGRLGKHAKSSGGCIYIKRLADVDAEVLETLIAEAWAQG